MIGWSAFSRQVGIRSDRLAFICASLDFVATGPTSPSLRSLLRRDRLHLCSVDCLQSAQIQGETISQIISLSLLNRQITSPTFCWTRLQKYQRTSPPSCLPAGRSGREGKGRLGKIRKEKNRNKTLWRKRQSIFLPPNLNLYQNSLTLNAS